VCEIIQTKCQVETPQRYAIGNARLAAQRKDIKAGSSRYHQVTMKSEQEEFHKLRSEAAAATTTKVITESHHHCFTKTHQRPNP
jgi:hypothetical protein